MATPPPNYSAAELAELARKLQEIERLSQKFNANINTLNLQDLVNNAGAIESIFNDLVTRERELGAETDYLISNFEELSKKIRNSSNGIQESNKGLKNLSSIAEQLNSHQKGYNELSSKELKTLQQKATIERDRLNRSLTTLQNESDELTRQLQGLSQQDPKYALIQGRLDKINDQQGKISALMSNQDITLGELNNQLEKEYQNVKKIEKEIGLTGQLLKGISKIPFIGEAVDTKKALDAAKDAAKQGAGAFGSMKAALKSIGGDVLTALKDPLAISLFLLKQLYEAFKLVDKGIGDFAKGMNLSYQDAADLDQKFNSIANYSGDIAVTTKGIRDTMLAMGQAMGSNAILNEKDAVTFTKLREQAGLTNEELAKMETLSLATGKSLESNVANTLYAAKTTALKNGVLLNEKMIMQEVAKASAATKLSLQNNPELLAKAAAQAKALGMNLEQVDKIAEHLLQIESSISNELEAELLLGKNLNLEQARLYALNNDMAGVAREIAKNYGSAAEFSKLNRIQQEAAAKAVGMSREELAKTLTDQEALKGLSGKQAEDAKAALAAARARGMTEEEIKEKGIDGLMKQQSIQERINNSVEKLKELFVSLVEPLMPVVDILSNILTVVGLILYPIQLIFDLFGKIGSAISNLLGPLGLVGKIMKGLTGIAIVYAAYKAFAAAASIPIAGAILGPIAAAATLAAGFGALNKIKTADDLVSKPGYGKRTLQGPEGAIALNDKDTVIAGTNLFDKKGDDIKSEPGKATEFKNKGEIKSSGVDMSALIAKLDTLIAATQAQNTKPVQVAVNMDGKKIAEGLGNNATQLGTAVNVGTSKIQ